MQQGKVVAGTTNSELKRLSITQNIEINDISYKFSSRNVFDKFSMIVPTNFEELTSELAVTKYPLVSRPQIVLSNPDATVDVFFNCGVKKTHVSIADRMILYKSVVKNLNSSYEFFTARAGSRLAYFDFRSYTIDSDMYNLWFLVDLPDNTIFGGFSCLIHWQLQWHVLALQMLQTIAALPPNKE